MDDLQIDPKVLNRVHEIELDLLKAFADVCDRNGLAYFLDGGTLLGAVRHQGFIPWDDDVDVIMPREDYDRLWDIADKEFSAPYFFQTTLSEDGFFRSHAQLRNSKTTGCIVEDAHRDIDRGIFLDIFPLDALPDGRWAKRRLRRSIEICMKIFDHVFVYDYGKMSFKGRVCTRLCRLFFKFIPYKDFFRYFNARILGRYSHDHATKMVGDLSLAWRDNVHWERTWFSDHVHLSFEGIRFRAPVGYDEVLRHQYGDYMRIPEDISGPNGRVHGSVIFAPDTPYREFFDRYSAGGRYRPQS